VSASSPSTGELQYLSEDLDRGYAEMAADKAAEAEALEWIEVLIGDIADEPR
jgi:hypothetical protein